MEGSCLPCSPFCTSESIPQPSEGTGHLGQGKMPIRPVYAYKPSARLYLQQCGSRDGEGDMQ